MDQLTALYTLFMLIATACYLAPFVVGAILLIKLLKYRKKKDKHITRKVLIKSLVNTLLSLLITILFAYLFANAQINKSHIADVSNKETGLFILRTIKAFLHLSSIAILVPLMIFTVYMALKLIMQLIRYKKTNA